MRESGQVEGGFWVAGARWEILPCALYSYV